MFPGVSGCEPEIGCNQTQEVVMRNTAVVLCLFLAVACGSDDLSPVVEESSLLQQGLDGNDVSITEGSPGLTATCPSGAFCLWWDSSHGGSRFTAYYNSGTKGLCQNLNDWGWSDRASSYQNSASAAACLYWDRDCGGSRIRILSGSSANSMGSWNDKASSFRLGCSL